MEKKVFSDDGQATCEPKKQDCDRLNPAGEKQNHPITSMSNEVYLNHPTFGLLYRVCVLDQQKEVFTTLYAQRLFFLVTTTAEGVSFEPITRADAKMQIENRLRYLRRNASSEQYQEVYQVYQQTF